MLPEKKPLIGRDRPLHRLPSSGALNGKLSSGNSYSRTQSERSLSGDLPGKAAPLGAGDSATELPG